MQRGGRAEIQKKGPRHFFRRYRGAGVGRATAAEKRSKFPLNRGEAKPEKTKGTPILMCKKMGGGAPGEAIPGPGTVKTRWLAEGGGRKSLTGAAKGGPVGKKRQARATVPGNPRWYSGGPGFRGGTRNLNVQAQRGGPAKRLQGAKQGEPRAVVKKQKNFSFGTGVPKVEGRLTRACWPSGARAPRVAGRRAKKEERIGPRAGAQANFNPEAKWGKGRPTRTGQSGIPRMAGAGERTPEFGGPWTTWWAGAMARGGQKKNPSKHPDGCRDGCTGCRREGVFRRGARGLLGIRPGPGERGASGIDGGGKNV